jgi:UDPglucose 6-dehydrogenase
MKIAVAGLGYVGLSNALLLAQHNAVTATDIMPEKIALIQAGKPTVVDELAGEFMRNQKLSLLATSDAQEA